MNNQQLYFVFTNISKMNKYRNTCIAQLMLTNESVPISN